MKNSIDVQWDDKSSTPSRGLANMLDIPSDIDKIMLGDTYSPDHFGEAVSK